MMIYVSDEEYSKLPREYSPSELAQYLFQQHLMFSPLSPREKETLRRIVEYGSCSLAICSNCPYYKYDISCYAAACTILGRLTSNDEFVNDDWQLYVVDASRKWLECQHFERVLLQPLETNIDENQ